MRLDSNNYEPGLEDKAAEAIIKIQGLGYTFTFDIKSREYQACLENPDGSFEVIHTFANWHEIIKFTEDNDL